MFSFNTRKKIVSNGLNLAVSSKHLRGRIKGGSYRDTQHARTNVQYTKQQLANLRSRAEKKKLLRDPEWLQIVEAIETRLADAERHLPLLEYLIQRREQEAKALVQRQRNALQKAARNKAKRLANAQELLDGVARLRAP